MLAKAMLMFSGVEIVLASLLYAFEKPWYFSAVTAGIFALTSIAAKE